MTTVSVGYASNMLSVPSWNNRDIELFHGTILPYAEDIVGVGIDVSKSRPDCDFGVGFYCTTNERQAREWAYSKAARKVQPPAVVRLTLARPGIASLNFLAFVRGEREALDFWSPIHFFRSGGFLTNGANMSTLFPYDIVFGPVALWKSQQPMPRADQVSFHTVAAQQLLNFTATRSIISI